MSESRNPVPVPGSQRLTLSSPDAFLAAVPHLLGFPPRNSVVLVGLAADESGRESIRLTQRFDLPAQTLTRAELTGLAHTAREPMQRCGATSVIVVVFADADSRDLGVLPAESLVDELVTSLDERGMWVKDSLYSDGVSRWSYGCENQSCCPSEGVPISDELRTMIAAEFAGAGAAMVGSRGSLVEEIAPDEAAVAEVVELLPQHLSNRDDLEAWRDQAIDRIGQLASGDFPTPETKAGALAGLQDIRARDTALWDMATAGADRRASIAGLTATLRSAPKGYVAPVATLLAIQHWTNGDGARANACLDRAAADDPNYSLAAMTGTAIGRAMPPSSWLDMMASMDRDVCRYGTKPAASTSPPTPFAPAPSMSTPNATPSLTG